MSNNDRPVFTDEECMTIYLFGLSEGKRTVKAAYEFTREYYPGWFPHMPSYQAFNHRITHLAEAFQALCGLLISGQGVGVGHTFLLDSMPIMVADEKRSGSARVARELCTKTYCASQNTWCYGVKLHVSSTKEVHRNKTQELLRCIKPNTHKNRRISFYG